MPEDDSGSNPPPWIDTDFQSKPGRDPAVPNKEVWVYLGDPSDPDSRVRVVLKATPKALEAMCAALTSELLALARSGHAADKPVLLQLSDRALE
jgi:hypothetical protein